MADESMGTGRSRGRARGRPTTSSAAAVLSDTPPLQAMEALTISIGGNGSRAASNNGGNGGNGNGAVMRGRGGYAALRTRPENVTRKSGEGGKRVSVMANYFRLSSPRDVIVYDYHVDFEPNIEARVVRKAMLYDHKEAFGDCLIFDGMSNVKSTVLLPGEENEFFSTRRTDNAQVRIIVRRTNEIPWHHSEMMRLYNTQMRRNLQLLQWNLIGRHYFNPQTRHQITEHRLEVMQGLQTAINRHDDGNVLMVCDTVHKVIRADNVLQSLREILQRDRGSFQDSARREIAGQIVLTEYNNRTYKIDDIAFDKNPLTTFDYKTQGHIPLKDYYVQQYNIRIADERQPLLIALPNIRQQRAGPATVIYLVPELCKMTGLSESLKNDFNVRRTMTQRTQLDPNARVANLAGFIQSLNNNPQIKQEMSKWNIEFSPSLVELPARVMGCEKIVMAGNFSTEFDQKSGDFSKEIRGKPMFGGINITDWVIIASQRDRNIIGDFSQTLDRVCRPLGVQLGRPQVQVIDNDRTASYLNACRNIPPSTQIVVVILSNNNKERYDAIKKNFCCDQPVASQMVVQRTLSKKQQLMSVCTKIGIQMACKLGAQPWALEIPPKDVMVVGFDVHRDSTQRDKAIGGFVSSTNATLTKWYSRVSFHSGREELSNNFSLNFQEGIKRYHDINKKLPTTIIVYRDGVSEGEIEHVYKYELEQIQKAIRNTCREAAQGIKLTFVIVTKRINSRFFLRVDRQRFDNPDPGTIVDTVVTREERYDFYLISQHVRQGTVTPTMYNIIKDDTNWFPHRHQQLAYKLCHLYYNWIGTIRVPAPCQYAHKLAYLTGTALHRSPHNRLSDTLFYL